MVAVGLNLLPFCRRYKNVIHSLVAINIKETYTSNHTINIQSDRGITKTSQHLSDS